MAPHSEFPMAPHSEFPMAPHSEFPKVPHLVFPMVSHSVFRSRMSWHFRTTLPDRHKPAQSIRYSPAPAPYTDRKKCYRHSRSHPVRRSVPLSIHKWLPLHSDWPHDDGYGKDISHRNRSENCIRIHYPPTDNPSDTSLLLHLTNPHFLRPVPAHPSGKRNSPGIRPMLRPEYYSCFH